MNCLRLTLFSIFCFTSLFAGAQTVQLIGQSEEFILENVKGYNFVEERGIEHEEFNVLVFEDKGRELTFYFTFFQGSKICNYIKNAAPVPFLKEEVNFIKANFKNTTANIWENPAKTVQVQISESEGQGLILVKELRN